MRAEINSGDVQVLQALTQWQRAGMRAALVTVVQTFGSSPRPPGALLAVRGDGLLVGSVSGGCVDADVRERFMTQAPSVPQRWRYGETRAERDRFGLPCGGTIDVVLEPAPPAAAMRRLLTLLLLRQRALRVVSLRDGAVHVEHAPAGRGVVCDAEHLRCHHGPAYRLLLIGAGETSRLLAQFALALDYDVVVCEPRAEYADAWAVAGATLTRAMPDDAVRAFAYDPQTAVVALTHDPKLDDLALLDALTAPAFYVGAIGSQASNAKRRARLAGFGIDAAALQRLHGPVGLRIGSRTPGEIAIAILAELTAERARGAHTAAAPAACTAGDAPVQGELAP